MASSEWDRGSHGAWRAKLTDTRAWCTAINNYKQWIQINLRRIVRIYGVVIQGRYDFGQWVEKFKVMYKDIGTQWTFVKKYESDEDMVSCIDVIRVVLSKTLKQNVFYALV